MTGRNRGRRHLAIIHPDSAGIDVGSREMWVAIPADRAGDTVRQFGMFTDDLEAIREWLRAARITTVAMESTGVYWIPLYDVLSSAGVEVCLVNPRELKSVPGRKSDLKDCQWLQELHAFGLLRASFRPDDQACRMRSLVRQRQELIDAAARQVQLMQKAMTQMNIRLTPVCPPGREVVADITGKTGMGIIRAILPAWRADRSGKRSPKTLVEFRDRRCKHDADTFGRALVGTWRSEHLLALSHAVTLWDTYQRLIDETEAAIKSAVDARPSLAQTGNADDGERTPRRKSKSDYTVDIVASWKKASDVDLTEIDGISDSTASIIMAEVGLNIDRFETPGRFASWLGLCPAHDISGGKVLRRRTRSCANRASKALRLAAQAAGRTETALGAFFRRIAARACLPARQAGKPVAITATAHKLARIVWTMLTTGAAYIRASAASAEERYRQRQIHSLIQRARSFGLHITCPVPSEAS
jgi:transposase